MIVTNIETYPGGAPIVGAAVHVHLYDGGPGYVTVGDLTVIGEAKTVTGATGAWSLDLTPQASIVPPGTVYVVEVHPDRGAKIRHTISVPAGGGPWWVGDILATTPSALPIPTSAAAVSFTPTGTISATNVQAAIAELDTDDAAELAAAVAAHNASGAAHPGTYVARNGVLASVTRTAAGQVSGLTEEGVAETYTRDSAARVLTITVGGTTRTVSRSSAGQVTGVA